MQLAGGDIFSPEPRVADTTTTPQVSGPTIGDILDLPFTEFVSVGVIAQDAAVNATGSSAACAGLVGPGGQISVTVDPDVCTIDNPPGPDGLEIDLLPPTPVVTCPVGAVNAGTTATRVIPAEIQPDAPNPVSAQLFVYGATTAEVLSPGVTELADLVVRASR